jgi:FkbH-like protein
VVETINNRLELLVQSIRNAILIDEYETARKAGFKKCAREVFPKSVTSGGMLHTGYLGYYLSSPYLKVLNAFKNLGKCKAIMLDFDNTLWQGVMGDGEVEHFSDRQALLKRLKEMGILLVSVSKNSEENIRWDEMVLKYDDFVLHKINWDLKIQSITSAVAELNIGMDSIIFIDDNPVEIELVKQELKDIVVLDATKESTWSQLEMMLSFPNTKETDESRKRTEMYRQSFERKKSLNQEKYDYPKLMASLELKVSFRKALKSDLERIDELVNRTNQFNTTTIRYSKDELHAMMEGSLHELYVATLSDKFGSLGVVLVVILELQGTTTVINSFIMSCRAMGFALENQVMHLLTTPGFMTHTKLVGLFKETDRNTPCASLYKNSHFSESAEGEWVYYPGKDIPLPAINWIEMVE